MIGTKINLIDQSNIPMLETIEAADNSPVVLAPIFADKGTEKFVDIAGQDYFDMFGQPSFAKYGQISIQNANLIKAGARIVGKRIVPDDATLANVVISASVVSESVQKANDDGELLYIDATTGLETTVAEGNLPAMVDTAKIIYTAQSVVNVRSMDDIVESISRTGREDNVFPIFAVCDNGRGTSNKKFYITTENELSKNLAFMFYRLTVIENGGELEAERFSMAPDTLYSGESVELNSISNTYLNQIEAYCFEEQIPKFVDAVASIAGVEPEYLLQNDFMFAATRKGNALDGIVIDTEIGLNLKTTLGIPLLNGTNGTNGDAPIENPDYMNDQIYKFFNGDLTTDIYDLNNYAATAVFDADFSVKVKNKIVELAEWRGDFFFFRDYGKNVSNYYDVKSMHDEMTMSRYAGDYCQAYDVTNPYDGRQVSVTSIYTISKNIIEHLKTHIDAPYAGMTYNAMLNDCIKGTLNYAPVVTPKVDEKDKMEDIKVNFASYFNNNNTRNLILESEWTSQKDYTQLSFINNVMNIQQVLRAVRRAFPAVRYQFISNPSDLEAYTKTINDFISQFAGNFELLEFTYVGDSVTVANKIYKAAIKFRCKDFAQAEIVDAYVLPTV